MVRVKCALISNCQLTSLAAHMKNRPMYPRLVATKTQVRLAGSGKTMVLSKHQENAGMRDISEMRKANTQGTCFVAKVSTILLSRHAKGLRWAASALIRGNCSGQVVNVWLRMGQLSNATPRKTAPGCPLAHLARFFTVAEESQQSVPITTATLVTPSLGLMSKSA
jgi:hypothetical protein